MTIRFLGQGFEDQSPNAIGNYLMKLLSEKHFHSFTGISAFASEAGIFGLSKYLNSAKQHFKHLNLVVGIDQEGTSKEALEEIINLSINSYIFYHREQPIFHPKIYLFEGEKYIKLLVGSSNLTGSGLFTNIESSLLIEFEVGDKDGESLLNELKTYYKTLFSFEDPNLHIISKETVSGFVQEGIVPDEETRRENYAKIKAQRPTATGDKGAKIQISKRSVPKIPDSFPRKPRKANTIPPTTTADGVVPYQTKESTFVGVPVKTPAEKVRGALVWQSGPLTQRDLNVPKGHNTNVTGSMLFKKGLTTGIDQRHYFRDDVFSALPWVHDTAERTKHIERTTAFFNLVILGEDKGTFALSLTHNTDKKSKSYKQKNSMTSLSWGKAKKFIAKDALIGKSATLFGHGPDDHVFTLTIQ